MQLNASSVDSFLPSRGRLYAGAVTL